MARSKTWKCGKKFFQYDFDNSVVYWVAKATKEMRRDDEEWMEKFGKPLWGVHEDGFTDVMGVGLSKENWENKEAREEYLSMWSDDLDEETRILEKEYEKWG